MKNFILIIAICMSSFVFAQNNDVTLLDKRDQFFKYYKNYKDTMTIRTWVNMVELSKRLEAVVMIDNILLDSLLGSTPVYENLKLQNKELLNQRDQLIAENVQLNNENTFTNKQKENLIFIIIIISTTLIICVIFWIRKIIESRNTQEYFVRFNKKIIDLKEAHKKEIDTLKSEIEKLRTEKSLLERNTNQVEETYEILNDDKVQKRKKINKNDELTLSEVRKEIEDLNEEISSILTDKQKLEKDLKKSKEELSTYLIENKKLEEDLENLLKKIKKS